MRKTVLRLVTVSALVAALMSWAAGPAAAGTRGCFGKRATMTTSASGTIRGTQGDDVIVAEEASTIYGRGGDDRICGRRGDENIYGGEGNDRMTGDYSLGLTNLSGGPGNDVFRRGVARFDGADGVRVDLAKGIARGHGRDRLAPGINFVVGSKSDDVLKGGPEADVFYGAGGRDLIVGRKGNDDLTGDHSRDGDKHDRTKGVAGKDTLLGGEGNETFEAKLGGDRIDGDEGTDWVLYTQFSKRTDLRINLAEGWARARQGHDRLANIENIRAGDGDDKLVGDKSANQLMGLSGNDLIKGKGGNDSLHGDYDDDRIEGGPGNDLVAGDSGTDVLFGGAGDDDLDATGFNVWFGGDHHDSEDDPNELFGGSGDDELLGNEGDDKLYGQKGNDQADGGDGTDDCRAESEVNCP